MKKLERLTLLFMSTIFLLILRPVPASASVISNKTLQVEDISSKTGIETIGTLSNRVYKYHNETASSGYSWEYWYIYSWSGYTDWFDIDNVIAMTYPFSSSSGLTSNYGTTCSATIHLENGTTADWERGTTWTNPNKLKGKARVYVSATLAHKFGYSNKSESESRSATPKVTNDLYISPIQVSEIKQTEIIIPSESTWSRNMDSLYEASTSGDHISNWRAINEVFSDEFTLDGIQSFYAKGQSNGTNYDPGALGQVDLIRCSDGSEYNIVRSHKSPLAGGSLYTSNITDKTGTFKIRWRTRNQDGESDTPGGTLKSWAYGRVSPVLISYSTCLFYNANGGDNAPSPSAVEEGNAIIISSVKPTRTGYDFIGWSTSANSATADFVAGDTITITENTTLYAVWKSQKPYFTGFNGDGNLTALPGSDLTVITTYS